jgi:hypothetical protein
MAHLNDEQIGEALAGEPTSAAHVAACPECAAKLSALRDTLRDVTDVPVPEPSPLFWTGFAARVNEAIDAPPPAHRWWGSPRLVWATLAAAVLVVAAILLVPTVLPEPASRIATTSPVTPAVIEGEPPAPDDNLAAQPLFDDDEAWELVRSVASDLDYDDAHEAGIVPRPGAVERAAAELDEDERAELIRLIEAELKRAGA